MSAYTNPFPVHPFVQIGSGDRCARCGVHADDHEETP